MTLEKVIKFYERNIPKKNVKDIRRYIKDCYELKPELFKKGDYDKLYLNILMKEYLNINNFKE